MDTTKKERDAWRKSIWCHGGKDDLGREEFHSVGGDNLERLLNDADRLDSMEGVVDHLKSMSEDNLTREDLVLMMAHASKDVVAHGRTIAGLETESRKLKQQIYRLELEANDRKMS